MWTELWLLSEWNQRTQYNVNAGTYPQTRSTTKLILNLTESLPTRAVSLFVAGIADCGIEYGFWEASMEFVNPQGAAIMTGELIRNDPEIVIAQDLPSNDTIGLVNMTDPRLWPIPRSPLYAIRNTTQGDPIWRTDALGVLGAAIDDLLDIYRPGPTDPQILGARTWTRATASFTLTPLPPPGPVQPRAFRVYDGLVFVAGLTEWLCEHGFMEVEVDFMKSLGGVMTKFGTGKMQRQVENVA